MPVEPLSPQQLREWFPQRTRLRSGAVGAGGSTAGGAGAGGAGATSLGGAGVPAGAGGTEGAKAASPGGARTRGTGAARAGGVGGAGARNPSAPGAGAGGTGAGGTGAGAGGAGAGGAGAGDPAAGGAGAVDPGAGGAGARGAASGGSGAGGFVQRRLFFVPPPPSSLRPPESVLGQSRPASPVHAASTGREVPRPRPPPVPGTHVMALRPSSVPLRLPLPPPPESSLPVVPGPESDLARAVSPTVSCLLATVVTDPLFESTATFALSDYPPSVGGECALGTDVLEDWQENFECLAATVSHLVVMLLAPEGDPDAQDIPTPRSYVEETTGPYFSQWQTAMDQEMTSWKSTGTYVDAVPPFGANIVDGMWIFGVKRPPGSSPAFKAPQRHYELHALDVSTAFLKGNLHEEIWLRRPPGSTGSFPAGTQWSLWRPVYGLLQAPREWHNTLRTTLVALGFVPLTADPSLFLRTATSLPPFYALVYIDDLVFATVDTEALALVLQCFGFRYSSPQSTPLPTGHWLSAPPPDECVEPSGPYTELVGCLMYLMTCTRPDLAHLLSILARYVAPGRHQPEHWEVAKRVLRYLCSTSGMGLLLGGWGPVVLTGHADASWVDDLATLRSSQGYTFSLGSGPVSWRSTRSTSVLSSSCEAEIYAGAMAAQELHWLTYLLTDLGEWPRSSLVLYVDNKAMIALCQEYRLEHRTKHIALRYFLARELQQRGQLRLAYVATRANITNIFTNALQFGDHQRFFTVLSLVPTLPQLLIA
ncbi:unnamed protein product [Closterium sp. NIES-54]